MKRPESHIKEAESFAYLEGTLKEWVLNRLSNDYGIDYDIQIFEEEESTNLNFGAQIKSTETSKVDATHLKFSLGTNYIDYFFKQIRPILFIVYCITRKSAFWVVMQEYVLDTLNNEKPDWLNQKYSTIKIPLRNVLTDKEAIKEAVRRCSKRIAVESFYTLSIDDGLGLNGALEDIEKLKNFEERTEYVLNHKKLLLAQKLTITGDYEIVRKKLREVYSQNKKDLPHLSSIIALIAFSNSNVNEENKKVFDLANEGLQIAEQLDKKTEIAILLVHRAQALHLTIIKGITGHLIARKSMGLEGIGIIVEIETSKRIRQLTEALAKVGLDVRDAFKILIDSKNYYILAYLLALSLYMTTTTIQLMGQLIGKEKFKDEIEAKDILAQHLINLIKVFKDEELELNIRESVANYYYYTRSGKDGLKILEPALRIAEKRKNQPEIEKINFMINSFKTKPDPYNIDTKSILEVSSIGNLTELVKEYIELQGYDLNDDSQMSSALNLGLRDMDPEPYLKYCKELHVHYVSTSLLGELTGVPSIGSKLLWCKHSKVTYNYHLDKGFETHKGQYCRNCKHRKPRSEDWVCTVGWFWGREVPKPIQEFKENMMNW